MAMASFLFLIKVNGCNDQRTYWKGEKAQMFAHRTEVGGGNTMLKTEWQLVTCKPCTKSILQRAKERGATNQQAPLAPI